MHNKKTPFCTVPFVEAFSGSNSEFRNCCATYPQIESNPGQTFLNWWKDPRLVKFREDMYLDKWHQDCYKCQFNENQNKKSFRTAVNESITITENFDKWPQRWNLKFGNICNLSCWTCNEYSSSTIAQHKKIIGILPEGFVDPETKFKIQWETLELDVLKSYDYHEIVTLTLLGGEPLYNSIVINFLRKLQNLNLANRTRLEFHTNATKINKKLFLQKNWNYVCIFLSLDAVEKKAEWLRYGTKWKNIESNINFFKSVVDYIEVQCTLSILNINDLPTLDIFCKNQDLPLQINLLSTPEFMSIMSWPGSKDLITDCNYLKDHGFEYLYNSIGTSPDHEATVKLKTYINQFNNIRKSLKDYDVKLYNAINL